MTIWPHSKESVPQENEMWWIGIGDKFIVFYTFYTKNDFRLICDLQITCRQRPTKWDIAPYWRSPYFANTQEFCLWLISRYLFNIFWNNGLLLHSAENTVPSTTKKSPNYHRIRLSLLAFPVRFRQHFFKTDNQNLNSGNLWSKYHIASVTTCLRLAGYLPGSCKYAVGLSRRGELTKPMKV